MNGGIIMCKHVANKLLHWRNTVTLPTYESTESLANDFAHYSDDKSCVFAPQYKSYIPMLSVLTLWAHIALTPTVSCQVSCQSHEKKKLLSKSPSKTCKLDPMPKKLVKQCHDSTYYECRQKVFDGRNARLNKSCYDHAKRKTWQRTTERLSDPFCQSYLGYIREYDLYMPLQSAYWENCCTETASTNAKVWFCC